MGCFYSFGYILVLGGFSRLSPFYLRLPPPGDVPSLLGFLRFSTGVQDLPFVFTHSCCRFFLLHSFMLFLFLTFSSLKELPERCSKQSRETLKISVIFPPADEIPFCLGEGVCVPSRVYMMRLGLLFFFWPPCFISFFLRVSCTGR